MKLREMGLLLKNSGVKFWNDDGPRMSAAMAFYLSLYLSPLLLTVVTIVGFGFGKEAARGEIVEQIRNFVGQEGAVVIEKLIAQSVLTKHGLLSGIVAAITLIIGATGLFSNLQSALNTIWMVPGKRGQGGIVGILRERLFAFVLVCGTAFLLMVSLALSTILTGINAELSGWLPDSAPIAETLNFVISFALTTTLFAMIFKWLPQTTLAWSDVWFGAVITAGMIVLGRYPIGFYLHTVAAGSAFGAAEAFIVLLVWVYYSSQILLFGAELTFLYATRDSRISQKDSTRTADLTTASH
jgi:membrane protein